MGSKTIYIALGLILAFAGCSKPSHTTTTIHHQTYSTFNFTFNGAIYNNSLSDSSNHVWASTNITTIYFADSSHIGRELNIYFSNTRYSVYLVARKLGAGYVTGIYRMGTGIDSATNTPFTYGTANIDGFTSREHSYSNTLDTGASYVNITEYSQQEIKGTLVLKCIDNTLGDISPVTGNFDIITR